MTVFVDARIPIVFGVVPGATDVVLLPDGCEPHPAGCACCVARGSDAAALDRLFLDRVRGTIPWFTRVVVEEDSPALRRAVLTDPVLSARFRITPAVS